MHLLAPTALLRKSLVAAITCGLLAAASTPARAQIQNGANGRNVIYVEHSRGSFAMVGPQLWKERLNGGGDYFDEIARDQWSVYLKKRRNGVRIMIDLYQKKIYWQNNGGRTALYRITTARKQRTLSRVPRLLSPQNGATLPQNPWQFSWTRVPGATMYHLLVEHPSTNRRLISKAVYGTSHTHYHPNGGLASFLVRGFTVKVRAKVNGSWKPWSSSRTFNVRRRIIVRRQVRLTTVTCRQLNEGHDEVYLRIMDGNGNFHTTPARNFHYVGQTLQFNTRNFSFGRLGKVVVEIWEDDDFLRGDDDLLLRMEILQNGRSRVVGGDNTYSVRHVRS